MTEMIHITGVLLLVDDAVLVTVRNYLLLVSTQNETTTKGSNILFLGRREGPQKDSA